MIWFILCQVKKRTGWRWPYWLYKAYLRSTLWRYKRQQIINRAGLYCEECGKFTKYFEVHHLTYDNLGDEPSYDLMALCSSCHKEVHNIPSKERIV